MDFATNYDWTLGYLTKIINDYNSSTIELVSKELNHLAAILLVYEVKKNIIIFQKENGNTVTLLIIFIVKSLQKEQNSTNLLL